MPTLTTLAGIETSEKNAVGPPGHSLRRMKPSMSRWKPRETCTDEKKNMIRATESRILLIVGVRRYIVSVVIQPTNKTKFMPMYSQMSRKMRVEE